MEPLFSLSKHKTKGHPTCNKQKSSCTPTILILFSAPLLPCGPLSRFYIYGQKKIQKEKEKRQPTQTTSRLQISLHQNPFPAQIHLQKQRGSTEERGRRESKIFHLSSSRSKPFLPQSIHSLIQASPHINRKSKKPSTKNPSDLQHATPKSKPALMGKQH